MMVPESFTLLLAAAGLSGPAGAGPPSPPPVMLAQIIVRQRVVVRVPARIDAVPPRQTAWTFRKGPKCIDLDQVAAAAVIEEDSIDLLLRGGMRVRAEFEDSCPDLGYYTSFYFRPGPDRRVCADRDSLHSRAGGECGIERFRTMEPVHGEAKRKRRFPFNPFAKRR